MALLLIALQPVKKICAYKDQKHLGWGQLYHLVLLFLGGYAMFGYYLISNETTYIEFVVAMIFLGGGWFVSMVSHLSLSSIYRFNEIAKIERHRALHDPLTTLANRTLFYERIDHALALAKREKKEIALMIIDLNEFKEVNDTLGHQAGDKLLLQASQRLQGLLRESDTLARFGGDEFAIILPQTSKSQAHGLAERLTNAIHESFIIENRSLTISMSVGIAMYPHHGCDSSTLIKCADIAMYRAKRYQKAFLLFKDEMHDVLDQNLDLDLVTTASAQQRQTASNERGLLN